MSMWCGMLQSYGKYEALMCLKNEHVVDKRYTAMVKYEASMNLKNEHVLIHVTGLR